MSKLKTFSITEYYKGIELTIICVTNSKKAFAELVDKRIGYINDYAHSYDLRYDICNQNPNVLYAKPGLGGEAYKIFERNLILTLEEYKNKINKHREIYPTSVDYYNNNK